MKINTRIGTIELLKAEKQALDKARVLTELVFKHSSGELQDAAYDATNAVDTLLAALLNQGNDEPTLVAEAAGESPPY